MKTHNILFWSSTGVFFLFESVMPALTSHTDLAKEGIRHLGFPDYFVILLVLFKVLGGLTLILPFAPNRLKEWAYAGFTFNLLSACAAHVIIDGPGILSFFPLIVLALLAVSYNSFHRLRSLQYKQNT